MRSFFICLFAIIGVITLFFMGFLAWTVYRLSNPYPISLSQSNHTVLHLTLGEDHLTDKPGDRGIKSYFEGSSFSLYSLIEGLEQAAKDPKIKGILLTISHKDLHIATVQEIRDAFKAFKASGKFIYTYTDTFGELSNGTLAYYLAAATSKIWLMPLGSLNMTGIMVEIPFGKKILDDYKIHPQLGRREEYKGAIESATESDFTPAHKENTQRLIQGFTTQIIADISTDRGLSKDHLNTLMNSAPHFPKEALQEKLIDAIGYKDEVKDEIEKSLGEKPDYVALESYSQNLSTPSKGTHIAIIYGDGMISKGKSGRNPLTDGNVIDATEIIKAFRQASEDTTIKAIVFRIDSGGGDAIASDLIAREIMLANAKKPVIVSMSNYAASGGYWISCDARKIVAQPGTVTGSIGVFAGKMMTQDFWEHYGIHWGELHIGDNAGIWSTGQLYSEEGWKKLNGFLDQIYDTFLDKVSKGRHMDRNKVHSLAKGQVWTGIEGKENGLVDALGGLVVAIQLAKEEAGIAKDVPVVPVHLPVAKSFLEMIFQFKNPSDMVTSSVLSQYPVLGRVFQHLDTIFSPPHIEAKIDRLDK